MTFDERGRLLLAQLDSLAEHEPLTRVTTPIGDFGSDGGDPIRCVTIAYDPTDGEVYGVELGDAPNFEPTGQLIRIDTDTYIYIYA